MAAQFKGNLRFGCDIFGWSESYWLLGPDEGTAEAQLHSINDARMALSMATVSLVDATVVDATTPRVSFHPDTGAWQKVGTWATAGAKTVRPDLSMLLRMYSADDESRSRIFVRGVPSDQLGTDFGGPETTFAFTAPYILLQTAYRNAVKANAVLAHKTQPHVYVTKNIDRLEFSTGAHIRRAGRPFFLPHGRRLIA